METLIGVTTTSTSTLLARGGGTGGRRSCIIIIIVIVIVMVVIVISVFAVCTDAIIAIDIICNRLKLRVRHGKVELVREKANQIARAQANDWMRGGQQQPFRRWVEQVRGQSHGVTLYRKYSGLERVGERGCDGEG